MKTGLILEGGAMRGMFTAGVTDVLMEHGVTFDGAGVTLSMSSMLKKWDSYGTGSTMYNWIKRSYIDGDSQMNNNVYGLNAGGLLIASLRNGTLKNFTFTDKNANTGGRAYSDIQSGRTLSGHYYEENNLEKYGVEGILQVGDESGPQNGQFGYTDFAPNCTVTIRGQTSTRSPQKSYKIKIKKNGFKSKTFLPYCRG